MAETIGDRIRAARKRAVWGQAELARKAGISVNAMWQIENGRRQPRPATLRKIAAALGVAPSKLAGLHHQSPQFESADGGENL